MSRSIRTAAVALLALAAACADHEAPTEAGGSNGPPPAAVNERAEAARAERVARRLAMALRDPEYRAELRAELAASRVAEHKLHFQRYVAGENGRGAARIARASGAAAEEVTAEALGAAPLELYLPVPAHRAAWQGDEHVLVATALGDHDSPVAFDLAGRRFLLDPDQPPDTPVLALVPVEADFDAPAAANAECQDCGGDGGGGTGGTGDTGDGSNLVRGGIVMTYASFVEDFEGWLKGAPEFEIHILGPNSATDTTTSRSYQCIGERADYAYRWNMDKLEWSGAVRLFTDAQLATFEQAHPGRGFLVLALEDDDGSCIIRADRDLAGELLARTKQLYKDYNAAKDKPVVTPEGLARILRAGRSGASLISAVASLIKTNDELIGLAIADSVSGRYNPKANWSVESRSLTTNGWLKLEIR